MGPAPDDLFLHTRVFGDYKNSDTDGQIGDRRGRNYVEGAISGGPSHEIPNATTLLQLEVKRHSEVLVESLADRRDFYHQFATTYERIATNTVYPFFKLQDFQSAKAYERFVRDFDIKKKRAGTEEAGDFHAKAPSCGV